MAWEAIEKAIGRNTDLLRQLARMNQSDCDSMEDYVHKMIALAAKVRKGGLDVSDNMLASLMLTGLPVEYRPLVMAIENSTPNLTTDFVQNRLLQEVENDSSTETTALVAKSNNNKNRTKKKQQSTKSVICFICDKPGHYARDCSMKKNQSEHLFFSSFVAKTDSANEWFIDSGASAHMTMDERKLLNVRAPPTSDIVIGKSARLNVKCTGDVKIALSSNNGLSTGTANVSNVLCIPDICVNLISVSAMTKKGNTLIFDDKCCKIFNAPKELIATAPLIDNLYKLSCTTERPATALVAVNRDLWHRRSPDAPIRATQKWKA